jgi:hypothetical protein
MKKIDSLMLLLLGLTCFWACNDDNDSNPVLQTPSTFVLNTPSYASGIYDLESTKAIELTCTQPDYGFTAATTYSVQVALNSGFSEFETLPTTYNSAKMDVDAKELARALVVLSGVADAADFPTDPFHVFVRLSASVSDLTPTTLSNSIDLTVLSYYIELVDAAPATYYLIGACIGDGSWANSDDVNNIGVSLIPLAIVEDYAYDKLTGKGEFVYKGYFPAGQGFKLIGDIGSWAEQWGFDAAGDPVYNDKGSSDMTVPADGWYKITLNSVSNILTIDPITVNPTVYASMELVGDFEGWGGTPVVMNLAGGLNSHVWYADVTFAQDAPSSAEGCKFRTDDSWSNNWGGGAFPLSITGGSNILYKAGDYRVIFDDLNNYYWFIQK